MTPLRWNPSGRELRQFSALCVLVFGGLAGLLAARGAALQAIAPLLALAVAPGLLGLVRPAAVRIPYLLLLAAVRPLAALLSLAILGILYFGILTPTGWAIRLRRRDPLRLRHAHVDSVDSYWEPKRSATPESYLRQS